MGNYQEQLDTIINSFPDIKQHQAVSQIMDNFKDLWYDSMKEKAQLLVTSFQQNPMLFHISKNEGKQYILTFYEKEKKAVIDTMSKIFSSETSMLEHNSLSTTPEQKWSDIKKLKESLITLQEYYDSEYCPTLTQTILSLKEYIPHFDKLQKHIANIDNQHNIINSFIDHIVQESRENEEAVNSHKYKRFFTEQVVAWLLRSEVDNKDKVLEVLQKTYGDGFQVNEEMQKKLKKEGITLMDMTLDMLEINETDIKVLLYAMMVKKKTWHQQHPIPSELYNISDKNLNNLILTDTWIEYFQTAVQWWLEFHCKELYNKNPENSDIKWLETKISFSNMQDVLDFYLKRNRNEYIEDHKSDLLASARCLIHNARRSEKDVRQTILEGETSPFHAFENKSRKNQESEKFLRWEWLSLPIKDENGKQERLIYNSIHNNRHHENLYIEWVHGRFLWRIKSFESEIRKMRNNPKYNRMWSMYDIIANRFEIYPSWNSEEDQKNVMTVHKALFHHFADKDNIKTPFTALKWENLKQLYRTELANKNDKQEDIRTKELKKVSKDSRTNDKSADNYQEARINSLLDIEYQIIISETDKYWPSNHVLYDPKKRIDDRIRIEWSITKDLVRHICETELDKNIHEYIIPYIEKSYKMCKNRIRIKAATLLYINKTLRQYNASSSYRVLQSLRDIIPDVSTENITFENIYISLSDEKEPLSNIIKDEERQLLTIMWLETTRNLSYDVEQKKYHSLKADKRLVETYTDCYEIYNKL